MDLTAIENYLKQVLTGANPGGDPTDIAATAAKLAGQPGAADAVAPLAAPSSDFDVDSGGTATMGGAPQSLAAAPTSTTPPAPQNGQDALPSLPPQSPPAAPQAAAPMAPSATPSSLPSKAPSSPATASSPATPTTDLMASSDQATRQAQLAAAQRKANLTSAIGGSIAGLGDTLAGGLRAFGEAPGESAQDKVIANAQEQLKTDKANIETGISNDPNSAASQNARQLVLQIAPQMANQPGFNQMTDQELRDKLPLVDTMMKAKAAEDAKKLSLAQIQATKEMTLGEKNNQFDQKEWDKIVKDTNPETASRRTSLGIATVANNSADRALATLSKPTVTNQEAGNVMADISAIYQQGSPTQFGMSHQAYNTLYGKVQGMVQAVSGNPQDAMPAPIKQRLVQTLNDLKGVNTGIINKNMDYIEHAQPHVIASHQDEWNQMRGSFRGNPSSAPSQGTPSNTNSRTSAGGYSYTVNQ